MPKMKTKKAMAKRFSVTGAGKIKYKKCGLRHNMGNKSSALKRQKGNPCYVDSATHKYVMRGLPYQYV